MAEALPLRRDKPSDLQDPAGEAEILKNSDSRLSPHRDKYRGSAAMEIDDHAAGNVKKTFPRRYVVLFLVLLFVLIVVGIGIAVFVVISRKALLGTQSDPGTSCLDLKQKGKTESGYYYLKSDRVNSSYQVYCDMITSGGGWTLIASVHQSRDKSRCTNENMWYGNASFLESRNWENKNTFGAAVNATLLDYKSPGYFSLQASDIMISHVEYGKSPSRPNLKYHTENGFLRRNGGNLWQVYSKRYPLTPTDRDVISDDHRPPILNQMLDALSNEGSALFDADIPPLYQYVYDDQFPDQLRNGGNDLFHPYGMKVSVEGPNCNINGIHYGRTYFGCGNLSSRKSYPFFALLSTGDAKDPPYLFTVDSKGPYPSRLVNTYYHTISSRDSFFRMHYHETCEINFVTPSFCDVVFTVFNRKVWNSTLIHDRIISNFRKTSSHLNAVYGYTMITREGGKPNTELPIDPIAHRILEVLSNFSEINVELMLDALVNQSSYILDVYPPPFYKYGFEQDNTAQDRLSNEQLFQPYGMKIEAFTSTRNQSIEYGKYYKFNEDLIEISSKKSFPFFLLMKMNNPNLMDSPPGLRVTGGRPLSDERTMVRNPIATVSVGTYIVSYEARCSFSETNPSICDVFFVITTQKWNSQYLERSNLVSEGPEYYSDPYANLTVDQLLYNVTKQATYANAIMGYTLLSRQPGKINTGFPMRDIMKNILTVFSRFPFIGSSCANSARNLVAPVKFTYGNSRDLTSRIPNQFRRYTPPDYLQLRASTLDGNYYALCPGLRVNTCEPQNVCVGKVKTKEDDLCNVYFDWPVNGTSYNSPNEKYKPPSFPGKDIQSNILIYYRLCGHGQLSILNNPGMGLVN